MFNGILTVFFILARRLTHYEIKKLNRTNLNDR